MTRQLSTCVAFLLVLSLSVPSVRADESTWIARPSRAQLSMDPTLIRQGKGMLFVPAMSSGFREPAYQVLEDGAVIASAETGAGVLLTPGSYDLLIGSGTRAQMMRRPIEIVEDMVTLVKPWWAGLVIDVIDETRTAINTRYEIYAEGTRENLGTGIGVEEERGEAVNTWLLQPGVYNVVAVGDNVATTRRFSVRLLEGELVRRNLVVDQDGNFIGFYPPSLLQLARQVTDRLRSSWELSMSALLTTAQNTAGEDRTTIAFSGQIRNRSRYTHERHFADLRVTLEEGFVKEGSDPLLKAIDEAEIRTTYIYRLSRRFGPYLRFVAASKLFATDVRYDVPQDLVLLDPDGNVLRTLTGVSEFELSPPFYPLQFREGIGINSQIYRSFPLKVDLRLGLGARQTYVSDSFELSDDRNSARQLEDATSVGAEGLVIVDARIGRHVTLDSEFDILMPSARSESWEFAFENRLRTSLTPTIKLDFVFDFERQKPLLRLVSRQQVLLTFVKII